MTDRYHKLIVILDHPMRDDDCYELVMRHIKKMDYVRKVTGVVTSLDDYMALKDSPRKHT